MNPLPKSGCPSATGLFGWRPGGWGCPEAVSSLLEGIELSDDASSSLEMLPDGDPAAVDDDGERVGGDEDTDTPGKGDPDAGADVRGGATFVQASPYPGIACRARLSTSGVRGGVTAGAAVLSYGCR